MRGRNRGYFCARPTVHMCPDARRCAPPLPPAKFSWALWARAKDRVIKKEISSDDVTKYREAQAIRFAWNREEREGADSFTSPSNYDLDFVVEVEPPSGVILSNLRSVSEVGMWRDETKSEAPKRKTVLPGCRGQVRQRRVQHAARDVHRVHSGLVCYGHAYGLVWNLPQNNAQTVRLAS